MKTLLSIILFSLLFQTPAKPVLVKLTVTQAYEIIDKGNVPEMVEFKGDKIKSNERVLILDSELLTRLQDKELTGVDFAAIGRAAREAVKRKEAPPGYKRCGACGEFIRKGAECEASVMTAPSNCDPER